MTDENKETVIEETVVEEEVAEEEVAEEIVPEVDTTLADEIDAATTAVTAEMKVELEEEVVVEPDLKTALVEGDKVVKEEVVEGDENVVEKIVEKKEKVGADGKPLVDDVVDEGIKPDAPDDALIERAVIAGMSLADARAVPDAEALGRFVGMLEAKAQKPGDDDDDGKGGNNDGEEESLADSLPDLDPERYNDDMVQFGKTSKDIIRKLEQQVRDASKPTDAAIEQAARESTDWFDGKIEALGDEYVDVLGKGNRAAIDANSSQFGKRRDIAEKVAVLASGYEQNGKHVDRNALFDEAARLVIGDKMREVAAARKTRDAAKREKQRISKPGRNRNEATQLVEDEIAAELDAKFKK